MEGEIDIEGLQPTAARDALQGGHKQLLSKVLKKVQDALFMVLRDYARTDAGMPVIAGEEHDYINMWGYFGGGDLGAFEFFEVACEESQPRREFDKVQVRHLLAGDDQSGMRIAKKVAYCTSYNTQHETIDKDTILVRLDRCQNSYARIKISQFIESKFEAEDISSWKYELMIKSEDLEGHAFGEELIAIKWVRTALRRMCRVFFELSKAQYAIEFIRTDSKTGIVKSWGGKFHDKSVLVMQINVAGATVLDVGKKGPDQDLASSSMMMFSRLVTADLQCTLGSLGKSYDPANLRPGTVELSISNAETINFGGNGTFGTGVVHGGVGTTTNLQWSASDQSLRPPPPSRPSCDYPSIRGVVWTKHCDKDTGSSFYVNNQSGDSQWEQPADYIAVEDGGGGNGTSVGVAEVVSVPEPSHRKHWMGPVSNFIDLASWPGNEGAQGYYIRLPDDYCTDKTGLEPIDEGDDEGDGDGDGDDSSSASAEMEHLVQRSNGLVMMTSQHTCQGCLDLPVDGGGVLEYSIRCQSELGLISVASYRHPDTFNAATSSHVAFTQPVLSWPTGTFLPLPPDVGAMINPKGEGACTNFTFDLFVHYGQPG